MDETTRRGFLAVSAAASVAVAGCSGAQSADPEEIDTGDRPAIGPEDAPVTLTVFEDFACPSCRQFKTQITPTIIRRYVEPGDVRYLHADFPIPVDERWSYAVGSAARAVFEEGGNDAFWDFSASIYDFQTSYSLEAIEDVAEEVAGLGETAREAAESERHRDRLESDRELGERWGVNGTPTVFVNDEQADLNELGAEIKDRL